MLPIPPYFQSFNICNNLTESQIQFSYFAFYYIWLKNALLKYQQYFVNIPIYIYIYIYNFCRNSAEAEPLPYLQQSQFQPLAVQTRANLVRNLGSYWFLVVIQVLKTNNSWGGGTKSANHFPPKLTRWSLTSISRQMEMRPAVKWAEEPKYYCLFICIWILTYMSQFFTFILLFLLMHRQLFQKAVLWNSCLLIIKKEWSKYEKLTHML